MGIGMIIAAIFIGILLYVQGDSGGNTQIYETGMSGLLTGGLVLSLIGGMKLHRGTDFDIQDERTKNRSLGHYLLMVSDVLLCCVRPVCICPWSSNSRYRNSPVAAYYHHAAQCVCFPILLLSQGRC